MSGSNGSGGSTAGSSEPEIGTGKTIFVIAVVLGCFAVLYPKIFYHMMFDEKKGDKASGPGRPVHEFGRPPMHAGHPALHMRNEQGRLFYGEEGHQVRRTIDKELKPGPVPGMRPTMGGPGIPQIPRGNQGAGGGTMSILMPLYTTGIVIFFVYTVMRIMFKKNEDHGEMEEQRSRLHQQLRSQAITPEFVQHQQRVQAAVSQVKLLNKKIIEEDEELLVNESEAQSQEESVQEECKVEEQAKENSTADDPRDEQIRILKERLEETEKAMQMIVSHMAAMTTLPANDLTQQKQPAKPKKSKEPSKKKPCETKPKKEDDKEEPANNATEESAKNQDSDDETDEETDESQEENVQQSVKIETVKAMPLAQES